MYSSFLHDRKSRLARLWSNGELEKFAHHFTGDIVNVSGWRDEDKEGRVYADYFDQKKSYTITNYRSEARGFQGQENEVFLDLTRDLDEDFVSKYDVVFNHTVLEHIFEIDKAFSNLCLISKDIVIIVVPFLQPMHADYGDYWRFTPSCLQRLFFKNDMTVIYSSFNDPVNASVYLFCVGTKNPEKWRGILPSNVREGGEVPILTDPFLDDGQTPMVGANVILNIGPWIMRKCARIKSLFQ